MNSSDEVTEYLKIEEISFSECSLIVKAVDQGQISRDSYRELAAVEHYLPLDIKEKNELEDIIESEESDIINFEIIQEVVNTIGLGIHHLIIHLCVSGDGRNVGKKIKYVMITFMILNHESRQHHADYYYTVALYPGTENYSTLKFMLNSFCNELRSLKEFGLKISKILWKFELYFSSDWKFLAICLELNSANSKYFCP
ncbi:5852_t:CDS:2, partial [Funneliformis caledonium]